MSEQLSEQKPAKFLPAFFVDEIPRGRNYVSGELPLHITLLSPLLAEYDPVSHGTQLKEALNDTEPFIVRTRGGKPDQFLHDRRRVDVRRIVDPEERLLKVRKSLMRVIGHLEHDRTYDTAFAPHITVVSLLDKLRVREGQSIEVGGFAIVEKRPNDFWRVVDKIGFHGERDAPTA